MTVAEFVAQLDRRRCNPRTTRAGHEAKCPSCGRGPLTIADGAHGATFRCYSEPPCSREAILAALAASAPAEVSAAPGDPPMLKAALGYAEIGWKVFPLRPGTKWPFAKEDGAAEGGHLLATSDPATVRAWWKEHPNANIGLYCRASGIFVVDQDVKPDEKTGEARDGIAGWKALAAKNSFNANGTRASITWSGGRQNFYKHPADDLRNTQHKSGDWAGIDTRSNGYVVLPPSIVNGKVYRWEDEAAPITPLPDAAIALFKKAKSNRKKLAVAKDGTPLTTTGTLLGLVQADGFAQAHRSGQAEGPCPWCGGDDRFRVAEGDTVRRDGTKDYFACRQCGRFGDKVDWLTRWRSLSEADALAACDLSENPFARIAPNMGGGALAAAGTTALTRPTSQDIYQAVFDEEVGDARLFAQRYRDTRVFDQSCGRWYSFNGLFWQEHTSPLADLDEIIGFFKAEARLAHEQVVAKAVEGVKDAPEEKYYKLLVKRIRDLCTAHRQANVLKLAGSGTSGAGSWGRLGITGTEWDQLPRLVACQNVLLELLLEPPYFRERHGRAEDFLRAVVPTPWQGIDAPAPLWEKTLSELFHDHPELIPYLARVLGYALAGDPTLREFFLWLGKGANGKTLLISVLMAVLGQAVCGAVEAELFLRNKAARSSSAARPDVLALRGMRLAVASETGEGRTIDSAELKRLVGGDTLTGRALFSSTVIQFRPTHVLFQLTNHKPHADALDQALWDRTRLVPFTQRFVKADADGKVEAGARPLNPRLRDELLREASGILAWIVRGWVDYQRLGSLAPPPVVMQTTSDYRESQDTEGRFIRECLVEDFNAKAKAADVRNAYLEWCAEMGLRGSVRRLSERILERFEKKRFDSGIHYLGIALRSV